MSKTSILQRTAYHEAGHAVVWLELCKKWSKWSTIAHVHIITQGDDSGGVTFKDGNHGVDITDFEQFKDFIKFGFAGFVAEQKCDPKIDPRFTRWNCREDDEIALLTFAIQRSVSWSPEYLKEHQLSLISCAQRRFHELRNAARVECERIIDDKWFSVDRLARCLLLCGKVNGNFAGCCFEGHDVVRKILGSNSDPADMDELREILSDYDELVIGPSNEDEKTAWAATIRQGSNSTD